VGGLEREAGRTDEQLVRRYLDGHEEAFTVLVERHRARIYNVCLRIVGDPEDASDATQDAFLTAFRKLGQFRGDAAFTTWMHRVAINACYDVLRKRKRQPMLRLATRDDVDSAQEEGPPVADPADSVASAIDAAEALRRIPVDFRVVLVLADVNDLPYEEVARVLGLPVGTVKSRVHRGRVALARVMGSDDVVEDREPGRVPSASEEER
jgi:RNA polymerase sigma-70 factor, ECF subfamily